MFQNIKISILDILSLILPGAVFLFIFVNCSFVQQAFDVPFPRQYSWTEQIEWANQNDWIKAAVILGVSYTLGHFLFLLSSRLDGWVYDRIKMRCWNDDKLLAYVIGIKTKKIGFDDGKVLNTFKWSTAFLLSTHPEMYAVVERYVAESKFFRSLFVVLLFGALTLPFNFSNKVGVFLMLLVFTILSFLRYLLQRKKSIETAYQFVIALSDAPLPAEPDPGILAKLTEQRRKKA